MFDPTRPLPGSTPTNGDLQMGTLYPNIWAPYPLHPNIQTNGPQELPGRAAVEVGRRQGQLLEPVRRGPSYYLRALDKMISVKLYTNPVALMAAIQLWNFDLNW